jgi:uncharacterized protein (TIGR00251 family)
VSGLPLPLPLTLNDRSALVAVRLMPRAGRAGIDGIGLDAGGSPFLRVRVTAPPEGGKANRALVKLLAKALHLPPSAFAIVGGLKDRNKTVAVSGGADIHQRVKDWLRTFDE